MLQQINLHQANKHGYVGGVDLSGNFKAVADSARVATDSNIANLSNFTQTDLQYMLPDVLRVKYPEITYTKILPVVNTAAGVQTVSYNVYDYAGEATLFGSRAKDNNQVSTGKITKYRGVFAYSAKAEYSIFEVAAAKKANISLEAQQMYALRRSLETKIQKTAYFGDPLVAQEDLYGLFSNPDVGCWVNGEAGVPAVTDQASSPTPVTWQEAVVAAGTDTDKLINVANGISNQIKYAFNQIITQSNGVEYADTLLLPYAQYTLINDTTISNFTGETIATRLKNNLRTLLNMDVNIMPINELAYSKAKVATYGSNTPFGEFRFYFNNAGKIADADTQKDSFFVMRVDPEAVKFPIAMPMNIFPEAQQNLMLPFIIAESVAGTMTLYPRSQGQFFGI